jgi:hypothetical protein
MPTPSTFKTSTHGTCALAGRHTSVEHAIDCPVLGRTRAERLEAFSALTAGDPVPTQRVAQEGDPGTRMNSGESARVNVTRQPRTGARRGGRPRVHPSPEIAHREAQRAYRQRSRQGVQS